MDYPIIRKSRATGGAEPNLADYEQARASFRWKEARAQLDGLPDGRGLNIAHEAVDRHARGALADKVAIRWLAASGPARDITYAELGELTSRFANALEGLGVGEGERVFVMASRIPELYVAVLGTLKARAVLSPLFSAFGPEPILQRAGSAEPRVLVTTEKLYRDKIAAIRAQIPSLEHVIVARDANEPVSIEGVEDFDTLLEQAEPTYEIGGHRSWRHGLAPLYQRHDRCAQGRDPRARGGGRPPHHRSIRARFSPRRRLLVHRRSRLGDRDLLRNHLAVDQRVDDGRR
jgi:acetyl-CoA synthetase